MNTSRSAPVGLIALVIAVFLAAAVLSVVTSFALPLLFVVAIVVVGLILLR